MFEDILAAFFDEFHGGKRLLEASKVAVLPAPTTGDGEISEKPISAVHVQDTVEKPNSGAEAAQEQPGATTKPISVPVACCEDPAKCGESKYSESMQGFYLFYCQKEGHSLPCHTPMAERYKRHSTQVTDGKPPVFDDGEEVIGENDLVDEDTPEGEPF